VFAPALVAGFGRLVFLVMLETSERPQFPIDLPKSHWPGPGKPNIALLMESGCRRFDFSIIARNEKV
jgi:hypothetical protein